MHLRQSTPVVVMRDAQARFALRNHRKATSEKGSLLPVRASSVLCKQTLPSVGPSYNIYGLLRKLLCPLPQVFSILESVVCTRLHCFPDTLQLGMLILITSAC